LVKNRNNYFPQSKELGADEMRITFMGSNPFPPRLSQAGTCIMVECGKVGKFFFDFGSVCMRNIIGNQVPVPEINDIFFTHLHVDHYADLPYLYAFAHEALRTTLDHCYLRNQAGDRKRDDCGERGYGLQK